MQVKHYSKCQFRKGSALKSWVFKSFLKVERDAPALVVLGSSFHQRGTTNENSLDCRTCTDGRAKRRSLDEHSILDATFALTRYLLIQSNPTAILDEIIFNQFYLIDHIHNEKGITQRH